MGSSFIHIEKRRRYVKIDLWDIKSISAKVHVFILLLLCGNKFYIPSIIYKYFFSYFHGNKLYIPQINFHLSSNMSSQHVNLISLDYQNKVNTINCLKFNQVEKIIQLKSMTCVFLRQVFMEFIRLVQSRPILSTIILKTTLIIGLRVSIEKEDWE